MSMGPSPDIVGGGVDAEKAERGALDSRRDFA